MNRHVVLGGNGVVGRETIASLVEQGHAVASVTRSAATPAPSRATSIVADLLDAASALRAVEGAEVAYLTVGLPYTTRVWRRDWPVIMQNTIDACVAHGTHLVYFDNVYAYGKTDAPMTESTPIRPSSRKGRFARRCSRGSRSRRANEVSSPRSGAAPTSTAPEHPRACSTRSRSTTSRRERRPSGSSMRTSCTR